MAPYLLCLEVPCLLCLERVSQRLARCAVEQDFICSTINGRRTVATRMLTVWQEGRPQEKAKRRGLLMMMTKEDMVCPKTL